MIFFKVLFLSLKVLWRQSSRERSSFSTDSLTSITAEPEEGREGVSTLVPLAGGAPCLEPTGGFAFPQGHWAPQLRNKRRCSHFGEAAFSPFPSCSLLCKRKHPKLLADENSSLPAELCLMSSRGLRFLLGTFSYSSAVFFLPRRDPGEEVCSCLVTMPFAITSSSCAITLFSVTCPYQGFVPEWSKPFELL